jgi:O-antigen/teichoic acid export membrane protein
MNFQFINNSVWSVIAKVVSSLLGFATVAILLKSLGPAQYGVWVLLTSFMGWAGFLDLGVSNGIRNRLSQAFVSEDQNLARRLISTGFATSVLFASTFVGLYFVATGVFDLSRIFEGGGELRSAAVLALNLCVIGALSRYVLSLIQIILTVRHKVKIAENLNAITSLLFFLAVMLQADLKNIDLFSTVTSRELLLF